MRHKLILPVLLALFVAGCGSTTVNVTTPAFGAVQNSIPLSQKGAASGVASLNSSSQLVQPLQNEAVTEAKLAKAEVELIAGKAPLANPTFTGTPAAPTAAAKTNTTQVATTAFVISAFAELEALTLLKSEKGVASGVAELDSKGLLPEGELPAVAVTAKEKALGEVEGTVTLNLKEGSTFTATLKKNVTFKVTEATARPSEVTLILTENGTGGWTWSVEGASWVNSEPTFTTTKGTKNFESLVVNKSGGEIIALAGTEGKEGPKGATGAEGPVGAKGEGVPTGGSTGQFLKKKSSTNYDTEWTGGTEAPLTWEAVSLGTGVEQQGGEYAEVKCALGGNGIVYLTGVLKIKTEVTAGKELFKLPEKCRPTFKKEILVPEVNASNAIVSVTITKSTGIVEPNGNVATSAIPAYDGLSFPKEN